MAECFAGQYGEMGEGGSSERCGEREAATIAHDKRRRGDEHDLKDAEAGERADEVRGRWR